MKRVARQTRDRITGRQRARIDELYGYLSAQPETFFSRFDRDPASVEGQHVLIVGPGNNFYTPLILVAHGATVTLVDRFPVWWEPDFHGPVYARLLQDLVRDYPRADARLVTPSFPGRSLDEQSGLRFARTGLETLDGVDEQSVDLHYSNACFEHLEDPAVGFARLFAVSAPGAVGVHQIDFRWHRDFDRPLEYCAMDEEVFLAEARRVGWSCGNRHRHHEFRAFFEQAGFVVDSFEPNMFAEPAYLADVRPRLIPRYAAMDEDALRILSGCFVVRRPAPSSF